MREKISVELKSEIPELEKLGQIVAEFGQRHHLSSQALFHTNLALEEILTNVISYAYDDSKECQGAFSFPQLWASKIPHPPFNV